MSKRARSVIVCTGPCSFNEAAQEALELAGTIEFVAIEHNGIRVDVCPAWSANDVEAAWRCVSLAARGIGLAWREVQSSGHPYSAVKVAAAMVVDERFACEVRGRVAHAQQVEQDTAAR